MRLVSQTWITNPSSDTYTCTRPSTAVIASVAPRPLAASLAMLSCWSMKPAPIDMSAMVSAMTWRWRDCRSIRSASDPPTPFLVARRFESLQLDASPNGG